MKRFFFLKKNRSENFDRLAHFLTGEGHKRREV